MKIFKNIREFFWPLLEKNEITPPEKLNFNHIKIESSNLEKVLEYVMKIYDSESDRLKTVESKSSLFINIISVVTSIVLVVTSVLVEKNDFSCIILSLIILLFILTIYMSRTIWFSIQTLERKAYHAISTNDFLIHEKSDEYYKKLIAEITNKIQLNSIKINEKVNSMTMAQEYFKRAIVVVSIYSFFILLLFVSKSKGNELFNGVVYLKNLTMTNWNIIIIYTLLIISIILGVRANFIRRNKTNDNL